MKQYYSTHKWLKFSIFGRLPHNSYFTEFSQNYYNITFFINLVLNIKTNVLYSCKGHEHLTRAHIRYT